MAAKLTTPTLPTKLVLPARPTVAGNFPKIEAVPQLPRLAYPSVPKYTVSSSKATIDLTGTPSDPYALNSFTDILNRDIKEKHLGTWTEYVHKVPVLGDIVTAIPAALYTVYDPISDYFQGDWGTGTTKILSNVSETLDILANPVKGLIAPWVNQDTSNPMYQLPWYERMGAGLGLGDYGHYNYEYDTGFWLSDLGLELVTDPVDILAALASLGVSTAVSVGGKAIATTAKVTIKEVGTELGEKALKNLSKQVAKKAIRNTLDLNNIAELTAKTIKVLDDDALNVLANSLQVSLKTNKGIINDTTKDIMKELIETYLKNSTRLTVKNPKAAKAVEELIQRYSKTMNYNMLDYITELGYHIGVTGSKDLQHLKFFTGVVPLKFNTLKYNWAVKRGNQELAEKILDNLKVLLASPNKVIKYKKVIEESQDVLDALSKIEVSDFFEAANDWLQIGRTYNILNAADKLIDAGESIEKAILKVALIGTNPVGASIYTYLKLSPKIGTRVGTWFIKRIQDIGQFFAGKTIASALFDYDSMVEVYSRNVRQFDIFAGTDISSLEFGQPVAQAVYNDTMNWLNGFAAAEKYALDPETDAPKKVNLWLATPKKRKYNIWQAYKEYFERNGISYEDSERVFWEHLDRMGHFAHKGTRLEEVNISDYLKSITVPDYDIQLRELYGVFNDTISKTESALKNPKSFLKLLSGNDVKVAKSQIDKAYVEIKNWSLENPVSDSFVLRFTSDLEASELNFLKKDIPKLAKTLEQTYTSLNTVSESYKYLEFLKKTKSAEELIQEQLLKISDQLATVKANVTKVRNFIRNLKNKPEFSKMSFSKVYRKLEQIISPYFGKAEHIVQEAEALYALKAANRAKTLKVLEDPEVVEFIKSFHEGGAGLQALRIKKAELETWIKQTESITDKDLLELGVKSVKDLKKQLTALDTILKKINSLDAFIQHYSLLKQSEIPEVMQEVYLEVLEELPIQKATILQQDLQNVLSDVIQRMNEKLAGKFSVHRYTNEYFAQNLLHNKDFSEAAQRYLSSNQDAIDNAEFTETLFTSTILPEFSKLETVEIADKTVEAATHRAWNFHKNRTFVYLDFEMTGQNSYLDQIYDLGLFVPTKDIRWSYTHKAFDLDSLSKKYRTQILSRKTPIDEASGTDELTGIRELYAQLKSLVDDKVPITIITNNKQNQNVQIILTRLQHYAELANLDGNGELTRELNDMIEWFKNNVFSSSLSSTDLLKKFDGIPTVGENYDTIKRCLLSYIKQQANNDATLNIVLDESFITQLKNAPELAPETYEAVLKSVHDALKTLDDNAATFYNKGAAAALDERLVLDGSIYDANSQATFNSSENYNTIQVSDTAELLELSDEGRWLYKGKKLPESVQTADDAVAFLKRAGVTYAPQWLALNPEQQLSTYPVLINGKVALQNISGVIPVKFTKHIDTQIIQDYFKVYKATYDEQHLLTVLSQQMSQVLLQVQDFRKLDALAPEIERVYNAIMGYAKLQKGYSPYRLLREDLDIYHKYAVLVTMINDYSPTTPITKLKSLLNEAVISPKRITDEDLASLGYKKQHLLPKPKFSRKDVPFFDHPNRPIYPEQEAGETSKEFAKRLYAFHRANEIYKKTDEYAEIHALNRELNDEYRAKFITETIPKWYEDNSKIIADNKAYDSLKKELQEQANLEAKKLLETTYKDQADLRVAFRKTVYRPEFYIYRPSEYSKIFNSYSHSRSLSYENSYYSKEDLLANIYKSEETAGTSQARALKQALLDNTEDMGHLLDLFKKIADENNLYTPVMLRHAIIGQSHVELNDTYIKLLDKFKEGTEYNTFMACDAQIVNNLDDLMLHQVLNMNLKELQSLVYHEGKGVVILPVGHYLKDKSFHSFDLRDKIASFVKKYNGHTDKYISFYKQGDNLIIYANNYKLHVKQGVIKHTPLKAINYTEAFEAAFGYPKIKGAYEFYTSGIKDITAKYPENSSEYIEAINKLNEELRNRYEVYDKQTAFLFTHYAEIEELKEAHLKHHRRLMQLATEYDDKYSHLIGGYGRIASYENILEIHKKLPSKVRKAIYGGEDDILVRELFDLAEQNSFNYTTFGRAAYRKDFEYFAKSNYQAIMTETYRELNANLSALTQYCNFFFDDSSFRIENLFKYATEEEIFQALYANEDYTVAILGVNKKGLPKLETITIKTLEDVKFALAHKAAVIPNITFASIAQVVHSKAWSSPVLKLFSKMNYILKLTMLNTVGFIIRNLFDSTLKNYIVAGNATSLTESYVDALIYYQKYTQTIQELFRLDPSNPFRPDNLDIYFSDTTRTMDRDTFNLIHNFIENGPSAGSIKDVSEFYLRKSLEKTKSKRSLVQYAFETLMTPTKDIEQITRLALYVDLIKKRMTNTDAFRIITRTHFDYSAKTNAQRLSEFVIPFNSFQRKNFEFWLNMVSENPTAVYVLLQAVSSQWHFQDLNYDKMQYYQGRLSQMLAGNIILNEKGLTLKLNPSFMDPINLLVDPLEGFTSKLSPVIDFLADVFEDPKDAEDFKNQLMIIGGSALAALPSEQINDSAVSTIGQLGTLTAGALALAGQYSARQKAAEHHYARTSSRITKTIPSLFGSTYMGRANYNNQRTFTDYSMRTPRIRNTNIYNKLYTDTGKNRWQLRYLPIDNFTIYWRIRESTNLYR
jgi:hypothetical protein